MFRYFYFFLFIITILFAYGQYINIILDLKTKQKTY